MAGVLKINGYNYDVAVMSVKRKFVVLDSDKSGRSVSGTMIRSIIGTYYNYTVTIDTDNLNKNEYNELYDLVSLPAQSFDVELPFGDSIIKQEMYVTGGEDTLSTDDAGNSWNGLTLEFVAVDPARRG